jgi:pyrophosphatase PpaX
VTPVGSAAVVFDLDGTLIDSFVLIAESYRHAAQTVLGRPLTDDEVVARWGEPLQARVAHLAPDRGEELIAAYTAHYEAHHDRLCRPYPGIPEMLAALAAHGCRQGVVTSKRRRATAHALERFGLESWIQVAVCAEDVHVPKPAPDPILEVLTRLDAARSDAWMVGDAVFDIEAARGAGVRSVAALWGTREREALRVARPDYVAARPADVVPLVTSVSSG